MRGGGGWLEGEEEEGRDVESCAVHEDDARNQMFGRFEWWLCGAPECVQV